MMDARGLNRRGYLCRRLIIGTGQHGWRRADDYSIRMREQQLADQFEAQRAPPRDRPHRIKSGLRRSQLAGAGARRQSFPLASASP